ncbi:sulfate adenylyltransferase subunit 1 [Nonlabens xylanidelens]|uniref:sulfate adenylyltransferase n=1 Tax=Nonlabens xylanidelens TaxID=191564 RepID=A0A2S6IQ26_9FLAO|nr:GTP-binding protein [Nonlabens xylanidelens]PPK96240.1 sulfate adenylyltransferase subunit 1 [Nonlabens xylanidelens]PQJ17977.1 sulfate adenylyltransferase [Nonlabens xylanidelens]
MKNVLKIATAGSVDDGKSTLIGRLLYETKSLEEDKLKAIETSSRNKGYDYLDFSLATDGLIAEREQGITIDVAHIYFSTNLRSYIIADTPGHEEYTRNMITGASNSDVAIILIDARKGKLPQTERHFLINHLLLTNHIIVAVNKMDLVDYSEEIFLDIKKTIEELAIEYPDANRTIHFVPISALKGDNIIEPSLNTSWYTQQSVLNILESIEVNNTFNTVSLNIQNVIRPKTEQYHDFRGYAATVRGGDLSVGDAVEVVASSQKSTIKSIYLAGKSFQTAREESAVIVELENDINVTRGDFLIVGSDKYVKQKNIEAQLCWMDHTALSERSTYLLQQGTSRVRCKLKISGGKLMKNHHNETDTLAINDIGTVTVKTSKEIIGTSYATDKNLGRFIIIDEKTNNTAGVGFIL